MTARQTINLNNVIVHLALAISRQFGACQYRHLRFDRNTPLDCNTALEEIGYAIDLFKKIPNKLVGLYHDFGYVFEELEGRNFDYNFRRVKAHVENVLREKQ